MGAFIPSVPGSTFGKLAEKFGPLEQPTVYCFAGMLLAGLALKFIDRQGSVEKWLTRQPNTATTAVPQRKWDIILPGWLLGVVALVGLVVFSVLGAYIYYPDRATCHDQMFAIYAEASVAVRTDKPDEAIRHLEQWDQVVRKLEVGNPACAKEKFRTEVERTYRLMKLAYPR